MLGLLSWRAPTLSSATGSPNRHPLAYGLPSGPVPKQIAVWGIVLALCGCQSSPVDRLEKLALTYPVSDNGTFPGYRDVAEQGAGAYVKVLIVENATGPAGAGEGPSNTGTINGASGYIIDSAGHIVTAAHIALNAAHEARVWTRDGRVLKAHVIAVAPDQELALLKIDPFPGMTAAVAAIQSLRAGEPVLAIGTPVNVAGVVAPGRVIEPELKKRIRYHGYGYDRAFSISAPIGPGFSGGPVFNQRGEVVGMIASFVLGDVRGQTYESPGIAYAIPSASIRAFVEQVLGRHAEGGDPPGGVTTGGNPGTARPTTRTCMLRRTAGGSGLHPVRSGFRAGRKCTRCLDQPTETESRSGSRGPTGPPC